MYFIKINNMKFHSHIGVYQEEKKLGQNLEIDLVVKMDQRALKDSIDNTISYSTFYKIVADIVAHSRADLVETVAEEIIVRIKQTNLSLVQQVNVKIRKLAVPIDGIFDSVEIEMEW